MFQINTTYKNVVVFQTKASFDNWVLTSGLRAATVVYFKTQIENTYSEWPFVIDLHKFTDAIQVREVLAETEKQRETANTAIVTLRHDIQPLMSAVTIMTNHLKTLEQLTDTEVKLKESKEKYEAAIACLGQIVKIGSHNLPVGAVNHLYSLNYVELLHSFKQADDEYEKGKLLVNKINEAKHKAEHAAK